MKKVFSVLCVLAVLIGVIAVGTASASAADPAQTIVDVKAGDEVTYVLMLGDVPEKVIGCDFSVYYDDSLLTLVSAADYTDETDPDEQAIFLNTALKGEVKGNWSILSGINFMTKRNFVTLNLKAIAAGSAHISYYIRFMYGNSAFESDSRPQITEYTFTCDLTVNGQPVLADAQPELNIEETQKVGTFVNSVTGKGDEADVNTVDQNKNNGGNSGNGGNGGSISGADGQNDSTNVPDDSSVLPTVISTDAEGKTIVTVATPDDAAATGSSGGSMTWLWIVIGVIVVFAGGGIVTFALLNKKK